MTGCEALVSAALFACVARDPACLPDEHRDHLQVLTGIAAQESGFRPYAVRVEASRTQPAQSLFPATYGDAVRLAVEHDRAGRTLGLGLFQITHRSNWDRHFGPADTPEERVAQIARALQPCANMAAGAAHFAADWHRAGIALQLYNSGRPNGAPGYAAGVLRRVFAPSGGGGVAPSAAQASPPSPTRPTPPTAPTQPREVTPYTADTTIYVREMPHVLRVD